MSPWSKFVSYFISQNFVLILCFLFPRTIFEKAMYSKIFTIVAIRTPLQIFHFFCAPVYHLQNVPPEKRSGKNGVSSSFSQVFLETFLLRKLLENLIKAIFATQAFTKAIFPCISLFQYIRT